MFADNAAIASICTANEFANGTAGKAIEPLPQAPTPCCGQASHNE
jgi:hypothetical protein